MRRPSWLSQGTETTITGTRGRSDQARASQRLARHLASTDGGGEGPLRSESARLPGVTLALAAPGPPVQLRWTTLRVQGPTLRDAALANGGHGSPPVRRGPSPPPTHELQRLALRPGN